jgi:hypothetical protein
VGLINRCYCRRLNTRTPPKFSVCFPFHERKPNQEKVYGVELHKILEYFTQKCIEIKGWERNVGVFREVIYYITMFQKFK